MPLWQDAPRGEGAAATGGCCAAGAIGRDVVGLTGAGTGCDNAADASADAKWVVLFDGKSTEAFRGHKQDKFPEGCEEMALLKKNFEALGLKFGS